MKALARFPLLDGALVAYRTDGGRVEIQREDEDGLPIASLYLAPHEIAGLVHLAELAAVALRPKGEREALPAHLLELLEEAEKAERGGGLDWYDAKFAAPAPTAAEIRRRLT